jgi:hypothetical protein
VLEVLFADLGHLAIGHDLELVACLRSVCSPELGFHRGSFTFAMRRTDNRAVVGACQVMCIVSGIDMTKWAPRENVLNTQRVLL